MKKRKYLSTVVAVVVLLALAGVAAAFGMGNVDGVWQYVEDNSAGGAYCVTYGTGPGINETARSRNVPSIQTPPNTDENQVHYGKGTSISGNCPTLAPSSDWFDAQSGLGFDGNDLTGVTLNAETTFLLGRLTHYNRPIYLTDDGSTPPDANFMKWIDIDVSVSGIVCGNGQPPNEGSTLTFTYRINFDETSNNGTGAYCDWETGHGYTYQCPYTKGGGAVCPYDGGVNDGGCGDAVTVGTNPPSVSFTCDDVNEPPASTGIWTVQLLGITDNVADPVCPTTYPGGAVGQFVTRESATNNGCLYAKISAFVPTAVDLKSFTATAEKRAIVLGWETASEVDNLGFNLYRAESAGGERIQLNAEIIPSNVYPGSQLGAAYSYTDSAVYLGRTYTYWLEDVDVYGKAEMHGPVEVNLGGAALPKIKALPAGKPESGETADGGQTW